MVEIEKLKKKYMTVTAVENITMNIEAGRIYIHCYDTYEDDCRTYETDGGDYFI